MDSALAQFHENISRVRELGSIANAVRNLTTTVIDVSDIWRSQLILAVSAFDHFIHDMVRIGMIEVAKGKRSKTDAFYRFQVPIRVVTTALDGADHEVWIGESVREILSWQSFQHPDKIADAVRYISGVKLWEEVAKELNVDPRDIKSELKVIVDRRNKIAHEADMDTANPGFRWPITSELVDNAIDFIECLTRAIFKSAK